MWEQDQQRKEGRMEGRMEEEGWKEEGWKEEGLKEEGQPPQRFQLSRNSQ